MVYIDQVTKITDEHGCSVIDELFWTNEVSSTAVKKCSKRELINFINNNPNITKTKYVRNNRWIVGEDVRVVDNSYLRTDRNNTRQDNLGELER